MSHRLVRDTRRHMNTAFEFQLAVPAADVSRAERALSAAHERVAQLERELSEFLPDSPVARLNAAAPGVDISVPASVRQLLARADALASLTASAFDVTAKSAPGAPRPRVAWDEARGTARRLDDRVRVGFGAIGKGYALDAVRRELVEWGFDDYCLSAGGSSVLISGLAAPDVPWRWGWSWRRDAQGEPVGKLLVHRRGCPVAIGVSGMQEQPGHLRDPSSGGVAEAGVTSALVACGSAADADALSTALFVAGWDGALRDFRDLVDKPAMAVIDGVGVPRWNGVFQSLWGGLASLTALLTPLAAWLVAGLAILPRLAAADDAVDLGELGLGEASLYAVERNPLWILLPVLSLLLVAIHLKKFRNAAKPPTQGEPS